MPHYLVFFPPDLDKEYGSPSSTRGCQRRSDARHADPPGMAVPVVTFVGRTAQGGDKGARCHVQMHPLPLLRVPADPHPTSEPDPPLAPEPADLWCCSALYLSYNGFVQR